MVIPGELCWLFWEVDPSTIELPRHRDYVLERIMQRGNWAAMQWLIRTFTTADLGDFLLRKGARLSPRERAYWSLIAGVPAVSQPGGGTPSWAG